MKSKFRRLRVIHLVMIATIPMYGWVAESVCGPGTSDWTLWHSIVAALAIYGAVAGYFVGRKLMRPSQEALVQDSAIAKALKQWEGGHIVGMACAESVVLWGVVVRMVLGGTPWQASLFYSAALLLLLLWTPRIPSVASQAIALKTP